MASSTLNGTNVVIYKLRFVGALGRMSSRKVRARKCEPLITGQWGVVADEKLVSMSTNNGVFAGLCT